MGRELPVGATTDDAAAGLRYQLGFGNEFATEAEPGALPIGQNSPQQPPLGLYSELVSGSTFSAPRALNRRSYVFRIQPSVLTSNFTQIDAGQFRTPPLDAPPYPGPVRWSPFEVDTAPKDFLDGIFTLCGNGAPARATGMVFHAFTANRSMDNRAFLNADGEMLILPQQGTLRIVTELGIIAATPGDAVLLPRGMKFRVDLTSPTARGYICENYGEPFLLPDLGLIGSHGLANALDFEVPVAAYEDVRQPFELVQKLAGNLWAAQIDHSPFDVVAWRGNWAPAKYDMRRFAVMGTTGVDHPDPSIFCAMSSPSSNVSGPNVDFMILPPRWIVAEHTFRPPGFHRNSVCEILGVIEGAHESRASAFPPGSLSLHNAWTAHGPDAKTFEAAREGALAPTKIEDALIFMFETRFALELSQAALALDNRQVESFAGWKGFHTRFSER